MTRRSACDLVGLLLGAVVACRATPLPAPKLPAALPAPAEHETNAAIFARSDLPNPLDNPLPDDAMGTTIHRLSNGLTVYISTNRQQPRFSAWIAVRAGSRHDPASSTGLAHYLEHMLFKGSDELGTLDISQEKPHLARIEALYAELRGASTSRTSEIFAAIDREPQALGGVAIPNEMDKLYATLGIQGVNAFTSDEETIYISDVPANRLEAWARVEAERFHQPVFRLFYPELEAVYEEKNHSLDSPEQRVYETMLAALFPRHPYGTQPTIGTVEHLKTPAYRDMLAYFAAQYVPNNMAIVLAGDVDAETALPILEREFGRLRAKPLTATPSASVVAVDGRVVRKLVAEGEETVTLAWLGPRTNHEDEAALSVLDWVAGNASAGLLDLRLVLTQKVPEAHCWHTSMIEAGYFGMQATLRVGQTHDEVEKLLLGVVDALKHGEFTQDDVRAVILHEDIVDKLRLESNEGRVAKMATAFVQHEPWQHVVERRSRIAAVTSEDVVRVARKYLTGNYVVVQRKKGKHRPPRINKPKITPIFVDPTRQSAFARGILSAPVRPIEPRFLREPDDYVHIQASSGPIIAVPNRRNDLFALQYVFELGTRRRNLLCHALDLLETSGAGELSPEQVQKRLFALGTTVNIHCDAYESSIVVRGIDANMEASLTLLRSWLMKPKFSREMMQKLLANTLSQRRDALEDVNTLTAALAQFGAHAKDSQFVTQPSNRMLVHTSSSALTKEIRGLPLHAHTILYFGPRTAAVVASSVVLANSRKPVPAREAIHYRNVARSKLLFLHRDIVQAHIGLVFPRPPVAREDRPEGIVLSEYLGGGMAGLVFQELREARGLAYGASAFAAIGARTHDESALIGRIHTQADKAKESLATMLELLRRPISSERLAVARSAIDERYRSDWLDPRAIPSTVLAWDRRGEPGDPRPEQWKAVLSMQPAELEAFMRRYANVPPILTIMADRERIDLDALASIAALDEVQPAELFGYGPFPH